MTDGVLLAISTFPDAATADRIAEQLVTARCAACANIITAPVRSIYHWGGKLERGEETMVFFKTTTARFAEFQAKLKELHPYDVPEIVAFDTGRGLPAYLQWVHDSTTTGSPNEP
ncbi:divalent-cation tolerance protein CutA [soil metagenome]|nr:divalent-cation tolerance protein CutA [Chthoniobacterales bacterium]